MSMWTELMGKAFEVRQEDIKGVNTRSLVMGSGAPVIFLHGFSGHLEAFIRTAPFHADHFEVHLLDMYGHGFTGKGDPVTPERLGKHILDYMDVHQMEKAHLCGISMGGWVSGWLLGNHPDRFLRSTFVAAAGSPALGNPKMTEKMIKGTEMAIMNDDWELTKDRLGVVIHRKDLITDELVDVRYKVYHEPSLRANIDNLLYLPHHNDDYPKHMLSNELLQSIEQEVLLVWAEEDAYSPAVGAPHFVENLKKQKLVVYKDAGHWPPYERAEDFAKANIAFLKGGLDAVEEGTY